MNGKSALAELTRSFTPYEGTPNHLADYDFDKVKILRSTVRPKDVVGLLPEKLKPLVENFRQHVVRDPMQIQTELDADPTAMPKIPYWDPKLKNDTQLRHQLFKRMFQIGLLDLQPVIKAKAGIFCVKKKDPRFVRLIIDGRQANFMHRRPPTTRLGSSACLAELRLPSSVGSTPLGFAQECDVSDCFYQFRIDQAGAFFALDGARPFSAWKQDGFCVDSVYDYNLGRRRPTCDSEMLFPVVSAMSMGWSWALFLANEIVASIVGASAPHPKAELRERQVCPQLDEFETISSTYVDNVTIMGSTAEAVKIRAEKVDAAFKALDIPIVWSQDEPTPVIETVGCVVDFSEGVVRNKPSRVWRTHLAGLELAGRSKVRVEHVEIWLGHATSLCRLRPCLLSVFDKIYRFTELERGRRYPLWLSVRREIRQMCHLLWLARVNMRAETVLQVDAGDSADHGYALMYRAAAEWEIRRALRFREKWRYIPLPDDLKEALTFQDKERLCALLASKTGADPQPETEPLARDDGHVGYSLGVNTGYGQWLQQALSDGDWLKTSAIRAQQRARGKRRLDLDYPALVEPISSSLLNPEEFSLLWAKRWRDSGQHINLKEALVALSSLKRTGRVASLVHSLKLTLCDNLAVVLAFEKGRSSSPGLNRLCRVAAAFQLGLDIQWRLRHVESSRNVADEPSRWFEKVRSDAVKWIQFPPLRGKARLDLCDLIFKGSRKLGFRMAPPGLELPCVDDSKVETAPFEASEHKNGLHALSGCGSASSSRQFRGDASRKCGDRKLVTLEVFSGSGRLSSALRSKGALVAGELDIQHGITHDLTRKSTQRALLDFVLQGRLSYIHLGTPCTVFSIARKGIRNHGKARTKERIACELAFFTLRLVEAAMAVGTRWSIENPSTSMLWELVPFKHLAMRDDVFTVEFPMCAYGTNYKKNTRILTNLSCLQSLHRSCGHSRHAQTLCGRTKVTLPDGSVMYRNLTELAGAYPQLLAETWASLAMRSPELNHVETEPLAVARELEELLKAATLPKAKYANQCFELTGQVNTFFPKLSEHILFGQDSAATKEAKKARNRKKQDKWRAVSQIFTQGIPRP